MSFLKNALRLLRTEPRIDGLIPAGAMLRGTLEFSGTLWIDAEVHGVIHARAGAQSTLIIGPQGRIVGTIEADQITVHGAVTGRIRAHDALVFERGAQVIAEEMVHPGFIVRSGAHVEGASAAPAQPQPDTARPRANVQLLRAEPRRELPGAGEASAVRRSAGPA